MLDSQIPLRLGGVSVRECDISQAIQNRTPVIHNATASCGEIEYECIIGTYPTKSGKGVILKDKNGRSITYALPENIRRK